MRFSANSQWDGVLKKGAEEEQDLRAEIWWGTPEDVLLRLLHLLPVMSLARFMCVSKRWRSAITTTTPTISSKKPILLSPRDSGGLTISDGLFAWKTFRMPQGLEQPGVSVNLGSSAGLVLAIHGLVACYLPHIVHNPSVRLSVHNPLVPGSARLLGHLPVRGLLVVKQGVAFAGIQSLQSTRTSDGRISFAVVCVTSAFDPADTVMHVFDSRRWSWVVERARLMNPADEMASSAVYDAWCWHSSFLLQGERLHFLTVSRSNTRSLRSVSIWDPEHTCKTLATWTELPLDLRQNPYNRRTAHSGLSLICCLGKLMLVGYAPCPPPFGAIGFVYLDEESRSWRELKTFQLEEQWNTNESPAAWGAGPESSTVTLCLLYNKWGCVVDLADSTWCPLPCYKEEFRPFHPSFLTPL